MKMLKEFWAEEDGIATVEILLILAVLIIIAILFRKTIMEWVQNMLGDLFRNADPSEMNNTPTPMPTP